MIKSRAKKQASVQAMAHQKVSIAHGKRHPRVLDLSDTGTGKTFVRIYLFAERRRAGGGCMLVVAPRSLLTSAWLADFKKFAPDMKVSIATAANREAAFVEDADVYITNHDAAKWLAAKKKAFFAKFSELAIDEITAFKHHTSQRSRAMSKIVKHFEYRSGLTATPNSVSITDVWHPVFLLDDGKRLGPSFYAFRGAVCTPNQKGRNQHAIDWIDKEGSEEAVFGLLDDMTVRHKRSECIDLPDNHMYTIPFTLTSKMSKAYDMMWRDAVMPLLGNKIAQVTAKLIGKPVQLTAVNAAAVGNKLLQIASGSVYDNDHQAHFIDDARYELLLDLVEAREHSLMFYFWHHQRDALVAMAKKRGIKYCVYDSESKDAERTAMVQLYQAGQYQVMFAAPKSAAHGLTLTKGTATIWPGPTYDLEQFRQGNGRQQRIGQTKKTETITLLAENTIEEDIYHNILMGKDKRMATLLDLFSSYGSNLGLAA